MCAKPPSVNMPDMPPPPPPPPQMADSTVFSTMARARRSGQTVATTPQGAQGKPNLAMPSLVSGGSMLTGSQSLGSGG